MPVVGKEFMGYFYKWGPEEKSERKEGFGGVSRPGIQA